VGTTNYRQSYFLYFDFPNFKIKYFTAPKFWKFFLADFTTDPISLKNLKFRLRLSNGALASSVRLIWSCRRWIVIRSFQTTGVIWKCVVNPRSFLAILGSVIGSWSITVCHRHSFNIHLPSLIRSATDMKRWYLIIRWNGRQVASFWRCRMEAVGKPSTTWILVHLLKTFLEIQLELKVWGFWVLILPQCIDVHRGMKWMKMHHSSNPSILRILLSVERYTTQHPLQSQIFNLESPLRIFSFFFTVILSLGIKCYAIRIVTGTESHWLWWFTYGGGLINNSVRLAHAHFV